MALCPKCGTVVPVECTVPPEPPVDTWVKDRYGAVHHRGRGGQWGVPGMMYFGSWEAMWHARGPLIECGPWGREKEEAHA